MVFYGTFSTNRLYYAIEVGNISHRAGDNTNIMQLNNKRIHYTDTIKIYALFSLGFMETIPLPWLGFLRGVFLANHLASTNNLIRTTKKQNTYERKLTIYKKGH